MELTQPDHLTADFVGEPGSRTFFVQAIEGGEEVTLLVEKEQVAALGELLLELLARVGLDVPEDWDRERMRLREPLTPRWRAGTIAVGVDPEEHRFLLEAAELVAEEEEREPEQVRVWATEEQAKTLAVHASWAVAQGRPPCRFCGLPLDAEGHVCPRANGQAGRG